MLPKKFLLFAVHNRRGKKLVEGCVQNVSCCIQMMLGHELFQGCLGDYSVVYW